MADSNVTITFDARVTDLLQNMDKVVQKIDKNADKFRELGNESRKTGSALDDMFAGGADGAKRLVSGMTEVITVAGAATAAIRLAWKEYENMKSRQRDAADSQLNLARLQAEAVSNLGNADPTIKNGKALIERIQKASDKTGAPVDVLTQALSGVLSARGEMSAESSVSTVEAAAIMNPALDPDALGELSTAAMGLVRQGMSPEQALGFFNAVGQATPAKNIRDTARNIAPKLINAKNIGGGTFAESGALMAALATSMGDQTGDPSGTAGINLTKQLAERLPFMKSTKERIEAIQKDDKLRDKLFGKSGGSFRIKDETGKEKNVQFPRLEIEAAAVGAVKELLGKGDNATKRAFGAALSTIPEPENAAQVYADVANEIRSLPAMKNLILDKQLEAADTGIKASETGEGEKAILRDRLEKLGKSSGESALAQTFSSWEFDLATDGGKKAAAEKIREFAANRRERIANDMTDSPLRWKFFPSDEEEATDAKRRVGKARSDEVAKKLDLIADILIKNGDRPIKIEAPKGARPVPAGKGLGAPERAGVR